MLCNSATRVYLVGASFSLACLENGLERYGSYSTELNYYRSLALQIVTLCPGMGRHINGTLLSRNSGLGDMSHLLTSSSGAGKQVSLSYRQPGSSPLIGSLWTVIGITARWRLKDRRMQEALVAEELLVYGIMVAAALLTFASTRLVYDDKTSIIVAACMGVLGYLIAVFLI